MHIYHALINALSAYMIHINLNTVFYTHAEHSIQLIFDANHTYKCLCAVVSCVQTVVWLPVCWSFNVRSVGGACDCT